MKFQEFADRLSAGLILVGEPTPVLCPAQSRGFIKPEHAGAAGRVRKKAIRASAGRVWGIGEGAPGPHPEREAAAAPPVPKRRPSLAPSGQKDQP